ncbi:MAG: hypothetical protein ACREIT_00700 [Tepidisphaeraceae bacterium]
MSQPSPLSYASPGATGRRTPLARLGGALSIAGCLIGLAIFLGACAGYWAAMTLSILPLALGLIGFILTIVGGIFQKDAIEDTHVLAGIFIGLMAIIGGLVELAAWNGASLFPISGGA